MKRFWPCLFPLALALWLERDLIAEWIATGENPMKEN